MNRMFLKKGIGVVEVLVGSAILTMVLFAFTSSLSIYSAASADATKRTQALTLAQEGLEIARGIRDGSWSGIGDLDTDSVYGFELDEGIGRWSFVEGAETVDDFTRTVTLGDVYRNANDEITDESPSTYDDGSRFVKVEITWESRRGEQSIALESLLTNAF